MELVTSEAFSLPPQLRDKESVLALMAKVARECDAPSFSLLQESVHHLSQKARENHPLDEDQQNFLKVLFTCPWWGGKEHGMNEVLLQRDGAGLASEAHLAPVSDRAQLWLAKMARHYIEGEGRCLPGELAVYRNASIVRDTVQALRSYICELYTFQKPATLVATTDRDFLQSKYAGKIESSRKSSETKGFIFKDGTMLLDQKDPRLINLGNRFKISAMTSAMGTQLMTRWRIDGKYQFENFAQGEAHTGLPLNEQLILLIPSCLGVYMAAQGLAQPYTYFADWVEFYPLVKL